MSTQGGSAAGPRKLNENKPGEPPFQMKIEPDSVLSFKCQPDKNIVNSGPINCDLKITNSTKFRQTFKVKCTNNEFFRVRPPLGFVKPDESITLKVTFHSLTKFPDNNKHFFAIYHFRTDDPVTPARQLWTGVVKPEGVKRILASFETSEGQPIPAPTADEMKAAHAAGLAAATANVTASANAIAPPASMPSANNNGTPAPTPPASAPATPTK
uniref:Major sperm protein n=1 Tax=Panagrellus redivivus TaxID=6233 RepID=A0A7E4VW16_PANRE